MIRVEKFHMNHLTRFTIDCPLENLWGNMAVNSMDPNKDIVSLIDSRDRVIALVGLNHLRLGVAEVWVIRGEGIKENKLCFFKTIKNLIKFSMENMNLHRVELAVSHNDLHWDKWARVLGFEFEHICRAYDYDRVDHNIYVRIV